MKKRKNKNSGRKILIILVIASFLLIISIALFFYFLTDRIIQNSKPNTIQLSLKEGDFADVYVVNGSIDVEIINRGAYEQIQILRDSINEINQNETLPLVGEIELGNIVSYHVSKNNSDYIYALAYYFGNKGFKTEVTYQEHELHPGKLFWSACLDLYDKIDSDLKNANYCTIDSDCETLPLAGPYIEFGCYHYINKNENSTLFYNRMNKYSAECGNVIDLCAPDPESKCISNKCVESE
mgnify:CR=1 FL=1